MVQRYGIWEDRWLPQPSTLKVLSPPTGLNPNATVQELIDGGYGVLEAAPAGAVFLQQEVQIITAIPISGTGQPDQLIWRGTTHGLFTAKSAYYLQKDMEAKLKAGGSVSKGDTDLEKIVEITNPKCRKELFLEGLP
jgi:hypothetical protein